MSDNLQKRRDRAIIKLILFIPFAAFFGFLTVRDFLDGDVKGRSGLATVSENPTGFYIGVTLSAGMTFFGIATAAMAIHSLWGMGSENQGDL